MFVDYHFARTRILPLFTGLYQYVVAGNGVFIRASRPGLAAIAWLSPTPVNGLSEIDPYVQIERVPARLVSEMLAISQAAAGLHEEVLMYLIPDSPWRLVVPQQIAGAASVRPEDPWDPGAAASLIEVHSHHNMAAFFSGTDDHDETGFKVYAVFGTVSSSPTIAVRVGIYGHFYKIPADWVFDLPAEVRDVLSGPQELEHDYSYDPVF